MLLPMNVEDVCSSTRQFGNFPEVIAGGAGLPAGVPVITLITPVAASITTRSIRGLPTGAVIVPVVCAVFSVSVTPFSTAPASIVTVIAWGLDSCGAKASTMRFATFAAPSSDALYVVASCEVKFGSTQVALILDSLFSYPCRSPIHRTAHFRAGRIEDMQRCAGRGEPRNR